MPGSSPSTASARSRACLPAGLLAAWIGRSAHDRERIDEGPRARASLAAFVILAGAIDDAGRRLRSSRGGACERARGWGGARGRRATPPTCGRAARPRNRHQAMGAARRPSAVLAAAQARPRTIVLISGALGRCPCWRAAARRPGRRDACRADIGVRRSPHRSVQRVVAVRVGAPSPVVGSSAPAAHRLALGMSRATASADCVGEHVRLGRRNRSASPASARLAWTRWRLLALLGLAALHQRPDAARNTTSSPLLIPLAAWETVGLRRVPRLVTIVATRRDLAVSERPAGAAPYLVSAVSLALARWRSAPT